MGYIPDGIVDVALSKTGPLEDGRYPGFRPSRTVHEGFLKDTDVEVQLRDGTKIYVDIFRPLEEHTSTPTLIAWSPYGKHGLKNLGMMPGADVDPSWISKDVIWEGPDPAFWCERGYTIVSPDPRGSWMSEGTLTFFSHQEALDGYDVIEWIADQPWSNGRVGMLGVSYLAISQWFIAATRPPSLAAICPWEGVSDIYRELFFHGGIPEERFLNWWQEKSRWSMNPAEDVIEMVARHPLRDAYWSSKDIELERIQAPALVVASWSDQGMHTRGTLEGFKRIGSKQKWLRVHGQKKWKDFYEPASVARQLAFFDHFLRGKDTGIESWSPVEIEVRESNELIAARPETNWPLEATEPWKLYLEASTRRLQQSAPSTPGESTFDAKGPNDSVAFEYTFNEDTELTGGSKLHLVASADEASEMDIFVALRKLDSQRNEIAFNYYSTFSSGPAALGWLRGTHRRLLPSSTELQPVHDHENPVPIEPGQIVELEIEIWPTSVLYRAGEHLQLIVSAADIYNFESGAPELRHASANVGTMRIISSPDNPSFLLLPKIPQQPRQTTRGISRHEVSDGA